MPRKPRQAPRIRAGRRIALATMSSLAAGSIVLSSGYLAVAQPLPEPSDTHITEPPPVEPPAPEPPPVEPPAPEPPPVEPPVQPPAPVEPPAPVTPPAPAEGACTHTITSGDTLSAIALRYLGDEKRHPEIYAANRDLIEAAAREHPGPPVFGTSVGPSGPGHWIFPGTVLTLPGAACPKPTTPATPAVADCSKDTVLIGARGSGENPAGDPFNLGVPVHSVYTHLTRLDPDVGVVGVPYPAAPVPPIREARSVGLYGLATSSFEFAQSYSEGIRLAHDAIVRQIACRLSHDHENPENPDQKIVLVGYSQGAAAIREALSTLSELELAQISGVVLIGDPIGLLPPNTPVPPELEGRTERVCLPGDPVCDKASRVKELEDACLALASTCAHLHYTQPPSVGEPSETEKAAKFLAGLKPPVTRA